MQHRAGTHRPWRHQGVNYSNGGGNCWSDLIVVAIFVFDLWILFDFFCLLSFGLSCEYSVTRSSSQVEGKHNLSATDWSALVCNDVFVLPASILKAILKQLALSHSAVFLEGFLLLWNSKNFLCLFLFFYYFSTLSTGMFDWIRINLDYVHKICCNSSL